MKKVQALFVFLFCVVILSSCKPVEPKMSPTATKGGSTMTPIITPMPKPTPTSTITPTPTPNVLSTFHMVNLRDLNVDFMIELRYASANNFIGRKVYNSDVCLLHEDTAKKLVAAQKLLQKQGFRLKIWDAYRPQSVQRILYDAAPDKNYVANPQTGSHHNRGTAVDVTLVDKMGKEVVMPSEFDDLSNKAHIDNPNMSAVARKNLDILQKAMKESGFVTIRIEWWHFDDSAKLEDGYKEKYPLTDIDLSLIK